MDVNWLPYLENVPAVSSAQMRSLEAEHGLTFPERYRRDLTEHAGMVPERGSLPFENGGTVFGPLLVPEAIEDDANYTYSIAYSLDALATWSGKADRRETKLWPFATNTATGLFCLDYRAAETDPSVVFVDLTYDFDEQGAITPVAGSYDAALDRLQ